MKKRIVSMMLAAMVALSVVGCGSKTLSNDYVTVKQYKGLEVAQVEKVEVTDEQVEQSVQANLNAAAEKEPIKDRAAEKGDWVNIDYTGYIDDVAFEGGTATGSDLELGSGSFIGAEGGYGGFEDHRTQDRRRIRYRSEVFGFLSGNRCGRKSCTFPHRIE